MAVKTTGSIQAPTRTKASSMVILPSTRTTRARAATAKPEITANPVPIPAAKKTTSRKQLVNGGNAIDQPSINQLSSKLASTLNPAKQTNATVFDSHREPIMAYLRIRPYLGDDKYMLQPYLTPLSDTSVRMTDPHDQQGKPSHFRSSTISPSSTYTFSHVFPSDTAQINFFTKTTLPLVHDLLNGQNGLLFTYGVTNSGKTYTVQGGTKQGSAGILPRTLDVIFNSIKDLHGDGRFRPVRLQGVEPADPQDAKPPRMSPEPALAEVFGQQMDVTSPDSDVDPTVLNIDRNHEYTVWLSYAEVYNEKIFDLLASVNDESHFNMDEKTQRTNNAKPLVLMRAALPLKPSPASDNTDSAIRGKYISGLRQFRVHSASQAKALVKLGQLHRRVFGTLANRESSRSHGMVIVKVVKGHRGERDDPTALQISRLTLVDLAGSERTKYTHTTGDRLKEAGNINKSLMVLGQCMEVMRSNQRKFATSLSQGVDKNNRLDTRDIKKALAIVPFRHSKLTESLMDYFVGDGRVVMIVNVNPYDTGYDENSHVMRFAALAREVYVTPAPVPVHRLPNGLKAPGKAISTTIKELGPLRLKDPEIAPKPHRRKVTISMGGPGSGRKASEAILEVLEEDEPNDGQSDDDNNDEPINPLVDALFDEVKDLRTQLFESEMRCAIIEAETREEVMREMEARMRSMEEMYMRRLMNDLEQNEMKTDAKIDMLHQSGLFGGPTKKSQAQMLSGDTSEGEDVEIRLMVNDEAGERSPLENYDEDASIRSRSASPLARKVKVTAKAGANELTKVVQSKVSQTMVRVALAEPLVSESGPGDEEYNGIGSEDAWTAREASLLKSRSKAKAKNTTQCVSDRKGRSSRLLRLEDDTDDLPIGGSSPDDSTVILPMKQYKRHQSPKRGNNDSEDDGSNSETVPVMKKKKRQLGKQRVMTEEYIEKATFAVEKTTKFDNTKNIRRLTSR